MEGLQAYIEEGSGMYYGVVLWESLWNISTITLPHYHLLLLPSLPAERHQSA